MSYNIIKWVVFTLITMVGFSFFFQNGLIFFWMVSFFCFFGPRLENSMDRVYCGFEIAQHNIKIWDISALIFIICEILADYNSLK